MTVSDSRLKPRSASTAPVIAYPLFVPGGMPLSEYELTCWFGKPQSYSLPYDSCSPLVRSSLSATTCSHEKSAGHWNCTNPESTFVTTRVVSGRWHLHTTPMLTDACTAGAPPKLYGVTLDANSHVCWPHDVALFGHTPHFSCGLVPHGDTACTGAAFNLVHTDSGVGVLTWDKLSTVA